jgi:hypothetical protein
MLKVIHICWISINNLPWAEEAEAVAGRFSIRADHPEMAPYRSVHRSAHRSIGCRIAHRHRAFR